MAVIGVRVWHIPMTTFKFNHPFSTISSQSEAPLLLALPDFWSWVVFVLLTMSRPFPQLERGFVDQKN
jgi:hypothetical protein